MNKIISATPTVCGYDKLKIRGCNMYNVETNKVCDVTTNFSHIIKHTITNNLLDSKHIVAEIVINVENLQDIDAISNGTGRLLMDEITHCLYQIKNVII